MLHCNDIDFSAIMACRNADPYIYESIESFCNQSFKKKELIIVDDASEDLSIAKAHEAVKSLGIEDLVRFVYLNKSGGCAHARNVAIRMAKGKFVGIWDADDFHENERVSIIIEKMKSDSLAVCGSWARVVDENGYMLTTYDYPPSDHESICWMLPSKRNPMIDPSCIINKESIIMAGGWSEDTKIRLVPDLDLWFRFASMGLRMGNVLVPLTYYRIRPGSNTTSNKKDMIQHHVEVVKRYYGKVELKRHEASNKI